MEIYVKISFLPIFSPFFWVLYMILSDALILPISQLQTQQVMASQIRSHTEYLKQNYSIVVLILYSELMSHLALLTE